VEDLAGLERDAGEERFQACGVQIGKLSRKPLSGRSKEFTGMSSVDSGADCSQTDLHIWLRRINGGSGLLPANTEHETPAAPRARVGWWCHGPWRYRLGPEVLVNDLPRLAENLVPVTVLPRTRHLRHGYSAIGREDEQLPAAVRLVEVQSVVSVVETFLWHGADPSRLTIVKGSSPLHAPADVNVQTINGFEQGKCMPSVLA
jgi:hypothetical protein